MNEYSSVKFQFGLLCAH